MRFRSEKHVLFLLEPTMALPTLGHNLLSAEQYSMTHGVFPNFEWREAIGFSAAGILISYGKSFCRERCCVFRTLHISNVSVPIQKDEAWHIRGIKTQLTSAGDMQ